MKHDRRQMPREPVDLNNIDDDAQGTAPQEQNRFRIALGHTAAGVLLRWLTCLLLFCVLCLAALFLPVTEGFKRWQRSPPCCRCSGMPGSALYT